MVTLVKHEWHQVDAQFAFELDADTLSEIYPDLDEDEIATMLQQIADGEVDIEEVINEAWNNDVEIEWDRQYDDWWTDRKGGYEVTYELGDDSSWVTPDTPPEPTHKCTKCKWTGQSYDATWLWPEDDADGDGEAKHVCPMCDSDLELTEHGVVEEEAKKQRMAEIDAMLADVDSEEDTAEESDEEAEARIRDELEEISAEIQTSAPSTNEYNNWPFESPVEGTDEEEDEGSLMKSYPPGEYTVRIWGRTREIGVHPISKEQYDYWSHEDNADDLSDALNESYDYDDNETPEAARFELPYYEYQDKVSFWGFDGDDTHMTIEDSEGITIYEGDLESFFDDAHGDRDSRYEVTEELEELYPEYLGEGSWLMWTQGGKGSCIQTTIVIEEGEVFDPKKLTATYWDVQGASIINQLKYDMVELDNEGMDSDHDNWRGQWSEFNVYHNTK